MTDKQTAIEGQCPYCGSLELIPYGIIPLVKNNRLVYHWDCKSCKRTFDQLYKQVFIGQSLDDGTEIEAERKDAP